MRAIAVISSTQKTSSNLRRAFPDADLLDLRLDQVDDAAQRYSLCALLLDEQPFSDATIELVSMLKERHPALVVVVLVDRRAELGDNIALQLGRAKVDAILTRSDLGHPGLTQRAFASAGYWTVARVVERGCAGCVPHFTALNVIKAVRGIAKLDQPFKLARVLGVDLEGLRDELSQARLFMPKIMLAWVRALVASRLLGDTRDTAASIAEQVGYGSASAMGNASRRLLNLTPAQVRERGGLAAACAEFQEAALAARAIELDALPRGRAGQTDLVLGSPAAPIHPHLLRRMRRPPSRD